MALMEQAQRDFSFINLVEQFYAEKLPILIWPFLNDVITYYVIGNNGHKKTLNELDRK